MSGRNIGREINTGVEHCETRSLSLEAPLGLVVVYRQQERRPSEPEEKEKPSTWTIFNALACSWQLAFSCLQRSFHRRNQSRVIFSWPFARRLIDERLPPSPLCLLNASKERR